MRFRFILIALSVLFNMAILSAQSRQKEAYDLLRSLRAGMTPEDSIRTLIDVYDLTDQKDKQEIGWLILGVAERSKNYDVLYEMLPVMSAEGILIKGEQAKLKKVADRLPEGPQKKAVETFIQITVATREGSYITPEERHKKLLGYLKEDIDMKDDTYQNFLDLYRVVVYMGLSQNGSMYMESLDRLEKMLDELPDGGEQFQSRIYTTAANYYTRNGFSKQAVEMDRKLLKFIARREKENAEQGRNFRSYDRYKYLCYLRMLSNYPALSPGEVEEYYHNCEELTKKSEEIYDHFNRLRQPDAYYLMAKQRYAEAIPVIEEALKNVKSRSSKYLLVGMLREAAEKTHNNDILVESLNDYVELLEERLSANSEEAMQELQVRYEVRKIEEDKKKAEDEKRELELSADNKLISAALIVLFILVIVIMILGRKHMRLISANRDLKDNNGRLKTELEELEYNEIPGTEDLHPLNHTEEKIAK